MSSTQIAFAVVAAALLFWGVGAYNRLVRLRAAVPRLFAPLDEQFRQRHALLLEQIDALTPALAGTELEALRAACQQVEAACARAKVRPGAPGAITSLRLTDEMLAEARARLPAAAAESPELNARLGASDATLAFARRQFNDAVTEYNQAVQQFPTLLLVGLFGFRAAATL